MLQPDAPTIINGTIKVVQNIVDGTKRFCRYYKGTCIPVKAVYVAGRLEKVVPSFYEEIIILPSVVNRVEGIQKSLLDILNINFRYPEYISQICENSTPL